MVRADALHDDAIGIRTEHPTRLDNRNRPRDKSEGHATSCTAPLNGIAKETA
jgi:hypothetical protein